jgi:hypothetical protein
MKPRRAPHAQPVTDVDLDFVAAGITPCSTAAQVATGQSGPGYLTVTNIDPVNTVYVGLAGVTGSTNGYALVPGVNPTMVTRYAAVETIYAIGSATGVTWKVER